MTIAMPDSITPGNLPGGYPAYLTYVDGRWPTEAAVRAAHPDAHVIALTVTGATLDADGCDRETGDLTPDGAAVWLHRRVQAGARPVLYASRDNVPPVLQLLAALGVGRAQIRILSAHYAGEHICGAATCGASFDADGTQYSDQAPGLNGSTIDMSILRDDFFGAPATAQTAGIDMSKIITVQQGSTGQPVRNLQALMDAHGYGYLLDVVDGSSVEAAARISGTFDAGTDAAVRKFQGDRGLTIDGIAGPKTWGAAIGVS